METLLLEYQNTIRQHLKNVTDCKAVLKNYANNNGNIIDLNDQIIPKKANSKLSHIFESMEVSINAVVKCVNDLSDLKL
jgi:uncharacterized protein YsxB (DUF464 family)